MPVQGTGVVLVGRRRRGIELGGQVHDGIVWSYETPIPEAAGIKGLFCFYNERVDLIVDGDARERPETPFSQ